MKHTRFRFIIGLGALVFILAFAFTSIISTRANPGSVMDFEGIPAGAIVDSVYFGYGVSGDEVEGVITVYGRNNTHPPLVNRAMIFDSTCQPGGTPADCKGSGEGGDLFKPELGNVLIITKDLDSSDPDDADWRDSFYEFDFSGFGTGTVIVESIDILDVEDEEHEEGARAELFSGGPGGTLLGTVLFPNVGDNGHANIPVNISGVDFMLVTLNGSGAIDNVRIEPEGLPTFTPTPSPTPTNTPTATPTEPTAVELISFQVEGVSGREVALAWETAAEVDNYGFRLYRSPDSNFANAEMIGFQTAAGDGNGYSYAFTDNVPNAGRWWYWLSDIDTAGRETIDPAFNPVSATVTGNNAPAAAEFQIFLPLSVAKSQR